MYRFHVLLSTALKVASNRQKLSSAVLNALQSYSSFDIQQWYHSTSWKRCTHQWKSTPLMLAFLKDPFPLTDSISKIMTIRSPSFSSPVTLLMFENPKGSSCVESCDHSDVCNSLIFLEKVSPALQVLSVYHIADSPILEKICKMAFFDGAQTFWRTVLVDTITIGTKWDVPKWILDVSKGEAFNSFPITSHNHILNSLLSDTMIQRIWIICFLKHCVTLTTELF